MTVRLFNTIFLLVLYLIFNLGIGLNFHFCDQGGIELSFFKQKQDHSISCHESCSHQNPKDICNCEDIFILLSISEDQLLINNKTQNNQVSYLAFSSHIDNNFISQVDKEIPIIQIANPPPKSGKQKIIFSKKFTFYA